MKPVFLITGSILLFTIGLAVGAILFWILSERVQLFGTRSIGRVVKTTEELSMWQGREICVLPIGTRLYFDSLYDPMAKFSLILGIEHQGAELQDLPVRVVEQNKASAFASLLWQRE